MLVSSHRHIRWYGVVNVVAVGVLALVSATAFVSLWCVWAAVTSVAVAAHLRRTALAPGAAMAGTARAK